MRLKGQWANAASAVAMAMAISACGLVDGASTSKDVFREDRDGQRRRDPTQDEILWTVSMGGCTGHLLAPEYMMTARHCNPQAGAQYTSGSSLARGGGRDIQVVSVVETSELDFAILKIRWIGERPADQKYPPLIAAHPTDVVMSNRADQGDAIFTVGFPGDRRTATYSEGQLKEVRGSNVAYDMGVINGNSGGGVWVKKNNMLVSLTNAGPHVLGQPGWNAGAKDDRNGWNWGVAMWNAYANSRTLKDIFPDGKNRYGGTEPGGAGNGLFVAVEEGNDGYLLQAAFTGKADRVISCDVQDASVCDASAKGYRKGRLLRNEGGAAVYSLSSSYQVTDGKYLALVALDASDKVVAKRVVRFVKAGSKGFNLGAEPTSDPTVGQLGATLKEWAAQAPSLAEYGTYGDSSYSVPYLRVSKAVGSKEKLPAVLINAATHGDEKISTTTVLGVAHRFLSRYGSDAEVRNLIDTRDVYFVPVVCVDGYGSDRREVEGQDPNRSYPEPGVSGSPRTRCARAMEAFFLDRKFAATIDYHASGRMVMYPWSAKRSPLEDDFEAGQYRTLAKKMADSLGMGYRWGQIPSMVGYTAPGSSGDYFQWRSRDRGFKTAAFGVEVGLSKDARDVNAVRQEIEGNFRSLKIFVAEGPTLFARNYALDREPASVPEAPTYASLPAGFLPGLE